MKRLIEQSLLPHPFLKRLGIIVIALLLAIITNYFIPGVGTFICFLILGSILGYLNNIRKDIIINGILFGASFVLGINILDPGAYSNAEGAIRILVLIPIFGTIPGIILYALGYLLKDKVIRWFVFTIMPLTALELWFSFYHTISEFNMFIVSTVVLPFAFCLLTNLKIWKASFITTVAGITGTLIRITLDIHKDPTSHNLLPIEIIINTLLIFTISYASAALGTAIKLLIKRNKEKHAPLNANKI